MRDDPPQGKRRPSLIAAVVAFATVAPALHRKLTKPRLVLALPGVTTLVVLVVGVGCGASVHDDRSPAWSPDGRKIAFVRLTGNSKKVYVMNADGSDVRRLTRRTSLKFVGATVKDVITSEAWSPDGRKIVFAGDAGILFMNADGSKVRRLTRNRTDDDPAWSRGGGKIAFTRFLPPNRREVYLMNADGSNQRALVPGGGDGGATWSPDGKKLAYEDEEGDVQVMNVPSGTTLTLPTLYLDRFSLDDYFPAWSPDGTKIAATVSLSNGGSDGIAVLNADGSDHRQLTNLTLCDSCPGDLWPAWSPDGSKIAFVRRQKFFVMNADGSNQHPLSK